LQTVLAKNKSIPTIVYAIRYEVYLRKCCTIL